MTRLPWITGKKIVAALGRAGFETTRTKGSHFYLRHPDGRATVVPVHSGETLGPGLLTQILRDCKLSPEDLRSLL
jgi:predicted RNA binding protein YcfA (HicA-like mRNA interferase family)